MDSVLPKSLAVLLSVLLACLPMACAVEKSPREPAPPVQSREEGFVSIFDGKTLQGWRRHDGLPEDNIGGRWQVIEGAIAGDQDPPGRGGLFITTGKYRDFILRLEVNIDYPVDSGVFLRVGETGKSHQVTLDNREGGSIGSIYLPWTQGTVKKNEVGAQHFESSRWQDVEIQIEGEPGRIRFYLDGHLVTDFQHSEETTRGTPTQGYIALQVHPGGDWIEGNKARFRNIRVKELYRTAGRKPAVEFGKR